MHIAVAGNIGSGKTSLTKLLAKNYGWLAQYDSIDNNPYLNDFYEDMQRWSFNLQVYFLSKRFRQIVELKKQKKTVIQDRTIFEDACIFAPNLHAMGLLTLRDYDNYMELYNLLNDVIKAPELLIYLRASVPTLVDQIQKRGRKYENTIRIEYLASLNDRYEAWINSYNEGKCIIINIDNLDFVNKPEDLSVVIDKINTELHGLFIS